MCINVSDFAFTESAKQCFIFECVHFKKRTYLNTHIKQSSGLFKVVAILLRVK